MGVMEGHIARSAERWTAEGKAVAAGLRDMADRVEREVTARGNRVGQPEWTWRAQQVVHAVVWGVANLNLDGLVANAAQIDVLQAGMEGRDARD